jgi:hypothetical protein
VSDIFTVTLSVVLLCVVTLTAVAPWSWLKLNNDTVTILIKITCNDFTYKIDKCGITFMFLFTVISKFIYK